MKWRGCARRGAPTSRGSSKVGLAPSFFSCFVIILIVMGICMINDHLGGMIIIMDLGNPYCGQKHGHHGQGCIFRLTCSHPELTEDHVLISAYVKIFRTVTRNAVNKSVWRKKRLFLTSLKQTCNEYLIKFSENQSAPKLENRKTSPCSPNLLHVLVSRIPGYHNLCSPGLGNFFWARWPLNLAISQKLGLKLAFLGIDWLTEVTTSGSLRTQYIEPCALLIAQVVLNQAQLVLNKK